MNYGCVVAVAMKKHETGFFRLTPRPFLLRRRFRRTRPRSCRPSRPPRRHRRRRRKPEKKRKDETFLNER